METCNWVGNRFVQVKLSRGGGLGTAIRDNGRDDDVVEKA